MRKIVRETHATTAARPMRDCAPDPLAASCPTFPTTPSPRTGSSAAGSSSTTSTTAAFPMPSDKHLPLTLKLGRDTALGALLIRRFNGFAGGATRMAVVKPLPPAVRAAYVAPYDTPAHRIATLRFVQDIPLSNADR